METQFDLLGLMDGHKELADMMFGMKKLTVGSMSLIVVMKMATQ